jgi:myo-inositol-1(or 4)-monophosphatase
LPAREADSADLILIERAVREAGSIARAKFGGDYKRWDKGAGQPVTEVDLAIDKFLHDALLGARPNYGWLSEESRDNPERLKTQRIFIVDPIDGTTAFMKAKPHFTVCAAVVENTRPVCAAVYNPITDECFTAALGAGAYLNGKPIRVSAQGSIADCHMVGPKMMFEHRIWNTPPNTPWPAMTIEARSSIEYRLALVAAAQFDATVALSPKHDWDVAAGDLIVHEAGGFVTDHLGLVLHYNGPKPIQRSLVAAGPALHARLLEKLKTVTLP